MSAAIDHRDVLEWHDPECRLRQLALWYRGLAERTGNPAIWEARLRTAERLEQEADRLAEASKRE